jgi:GT2 family glycosyltransferase
MDNMTTISFVIPSYNNLRYLKNAYRSIRTYAGKEHEIIVLDDASVDGTVEWLEKLNDDNLTIWKNDTGKRVGHTITYNIGGKMAKNEIFGILHADMFIGPNYVENAIKHLKPGVVVSATRIEPPLHPEGKEKIVKNFGMWPEEFKESEFLSFVAQEQQNSKDKVTSGIFAPWFIHKQDFVYIGGHDEMFAPFPYEDSDIFQRFMLAGYEIVQSRDSLVYHLTCRGHKWTDDTQIGKVDDSFNEAEVRARRNYIRKWNSWIMNDEYHKPILIPKYNTCLVLKNTPNIQLVAELEPWSTCLFTDLNQEQIQAYISIEQRNTPYNLASRVRYLPTYENDISTFDVSIVIDCNNVTNADFQSVTSINKMLSELDSEDLTGTYEIGNLQVTVNRLQNTLDELIVTNL